MKEKNKNKSRSTKSRNAPHQLIKKTWKIKKKMLNGVYGSLLENEKSKTVRMCFYVFFGDIFVRI